MPVALGHADCAGCIVFSAYLRPRSDTFTDTDLVGNLTHTFCSWKTRCEPAALFAIAAVLAVAGWPQPTVARQAPSPSMETGFLNRTLTIDGTVRRYQVYVPADYDTTKSWPLVVFLHGAGERGYDGLRQTQVGLGAAIRFNPQRWPAVVVFPQLPPGRSWTPETEPIGMNAIEATISEFSVDTTRVYLTGLSMGGHGSLFLASRHPERFAAVVAICPTIGGTERYPFIAGDSYESAIEGSASALSSLPIWLFHGENDPVFPASISQDLTMALQEYEADVRYTEYVETGHNAWDPAYENTDMITWLFQQQTRISNAPTDSGSIHH